MIFLFATLWLNLCLVDATRDCFATKGISGLFDCGLYREQRCR